MKTNDVSNNMIAIAMLMRGLIFSMGLSIYMFVHSLMNFAVKMASKNMNQIT